MTIDANKDTAGGKLLHDRIVERLRQQGYGTIFYDDYSSPSMWEALDNSLVYYTDFTPELFYTLVCETSGYQEKLEAIVWSLSFRLDTLVRANRHYGYATLYQLNRRIDKLEQTIAQYENKNEMTDAK